MVGKGKLNATGEERIADSASHFCCDSVSFGIVWFFLFLSGYSSLLIYLLLLVVLRFSL